MQNSSLDILLDTQLIKSIVCGAWSTKDLLCQWICLRVEKTDLLCDGSTSEVSASSDQVKSGAPKSGGPQVYQFLVRWSQRSTMLPLMVTGILCVWATHTSPEAAAPATAPPEVAASALEGSMFTVTAMEAIHELHMLHITATEATPARSVVAMKAIQVSAPPWPPDFQGSYPLPALPWWFPSLLAPTWLPDPPRTRPLLHVTWSRPLLHSPAQPTTAPRSRPTMPWSRPTSTSRAWPSSCPPLLHYPPCFVCVSEAARRGGDI